MEVTEIVVHVGILVCGHILVGGAGSHVPPLVLLDILPQLEASVGPHLHCLVAGVGVPRSGQRYCRKEFYNRRGSWLSQGVFEVGWGTPRRRIPRLGVGLIGRARLGVVGTPRRGALLMGEG
ncbi:hypothetical protein PIB30_098059, partial [Stylosanthes scabra]|nr:hypothetical protein [Stylosanthes scabra]